MDTIKAMDTIESVDEAALDLVVGGVWDNPAADASNQRRAAQNSGDGTVGGSIGGQLTEGGQHGGLLSGVPIEYPQ